MPEQPRRRPQDREHLLHDVDLVAAYAGDDPGIDRDTAAGLVASCPDCRSEYDLQLAVTNWLAGAPAVSLGDDERALLHDRVGQAIGKPTLLALPHRRRSRQPGRLLLRLGAAAAALAVIAGVGGVLNNLTGDSDGADVLSSELAAGSEAETTIAAGEAATTTAALFGAMTSERAVLAGGDAAAVKREVDELLEQAADPAQAEAEDAGAPGDAMIAVAPCFEQVEDREILLTAESVLDGEPIVIFVVSGEESSPGPMVEALVFAAADCSEVALG